MGLSEQERKIFDEIEQHLTEQDPRFVSKARKKTVVVATGLSKLAKRVARARKRTAPQIVRMTTRPGLVPCTAESPAGP